MKLETITSRISQGQRVSDLLIGSPDLYREFCISSLPRMTKDRGNLSLSQEHKFHEAESRR